MPALTSAWQQLTDLLLSELKLTTKDDWRVTDGVKTGGSGCVSSFARKIVREPLKFLRLRSSGTASSLSGPPADIISDNHSSTRPLQHLLAMVLPLQCLRHIWDTEVERQPLDTGTALVCLPEAYR
jgi:hypothetical protein